MCSVLLLWPSGGQVSNCSYYLLENLFLRLFRQLIDCLLEIGVMYTPRQTPGMIIDDLFEETLMQVSTNEDILDLALDELRQVAAEAS